MNDVQMNKSDLRNRIQENRNAHRGIFEAAIDGYREEATKFFEEQLAKAKAGKVFNNYFSEPIPEDHTKDYDAVLDMLDMDKRDTITLSAGQFRQYVRDEWGWKQDFMATSSNYIK
jgi:hypothetical protein